MRLFSLQKESDFKTGVTFFRAQHIAGFLALCGRLRAIHFFSFFPAVVEEETKANGEWTCGGWGGGLVGRNKGGDKRVLMAFKKGWGNQEGRRGEWTLLLVGTWNQRPNLLYSWRVEDTSP